MRAEAPESMVQALAQLLQDHGDGVLDGSHDLTLLTPSLQVVTRLYEQLIPRATIHGFQALPAHPTDSIAVLRTQFLLDILQKTPALKIIHPPEGPGQFDVNIFPFKSLRSLELVCLPPHCLRGLRGVYSQLEVLTCMQCVTSIAEVISHCGGDLSSALPWLELHTLNFSYNTISNLDQSLELLNSLRIMDLSHNLIKDCGPYLKLLYELQYLNLGYNLLESIPELNTSTSIQLHTLILRYNQLSSTNGLEQLSNLQYLDLSYNLLLDHSELKGLAPLHKLKKLFLEGNPLYYHENHHVLTAQHLSRKVSDKVFLDGTAITAKEIAFIQTCKERRVQTRGNNSTTESSCTGEMSDSCSASERIAKKIPRKKKVKVRRPSILERSDSECEQRRSSQPPVLQHQKEIERTNSFREQYGVDWLQYRSHLEEELGKGKSSNDSPRKNVFSQPFAKSKSSPTILQTGGKAGSSSHIPANESPTKPASSKAVPAEDLLIEKIEDVLEEGLWGPANKKEEEEEDFVDEHLCLPVTACPIVDGKPVNNAWPWVFLRVTRLHLLEIDLVRGRVQLRRELQSLKDIETSVTLWRFKEGEEEKELPVLTLYFNSVCEDKQCARYVMVDNTREVNIKTLLRVLNPILENNQRAMAEREEGPPKLQCLKCKTEFARQEDNSSEEEGRTEDKMSHGLLNSPSDRARCPSCRSQHVILAQTQESSCSSTPTHSSPSDKSSEIAQRQKCFYLGDDERDSSGTGSHSSPNDSNNTSNRTPTPEGKVSNLLGSYSYPTPPPMPESMVIQDSWQLSPTSENPHQTLDFRIVDHRLKLYLDMDIFEGEMEEFQCCMKVPVVRFGKEGPFWALVVVTNQKIYFLEISGETSERPHDWLQRGEEPDLATLTHLHIGLQKQTLHLGFNTSGAAYTLLTRNSRFSSTFCQHILETLTVLPARCLKALDYSAEEEIKEGHHLWHLLHDNLAAGGHGQGGYRYILAYFRHEKDAKPAIPCANSTAVQQNMASPAAREQGAANATEVSLLLAGTQMLILEESHQWLHTQSPAGEDSAQEEGHKEQHRVKVKEKQPISNISSVHLYTSAALHLRIQLYNEMQQKESAWLLWMEDPDLPKEVVEWLQVPWEAEYHIRLTPVIHQSLH